jgi:hypothetical protein
MMPVSYDSAGPRFYFSPSFTSKVNSPALCVSPVFCLRASFTHAAVGLVVAHQEERKRLKSERINGRNGQREKVDVA